MARVDVLMPQMGESIAEGTLSKWLKKVGDAVKSGVDMAEEKTQGMLDRLAGKTEPDAPETAPLLYRRASPLAGQCRAGRSAVGRALS